MKTTLTWYVAAFNEKDAMRDFHGDRLNTFCHASEAECRALFISGAVHRASVYKAVESYEVAEFPAKDVPPLFENSQKLLLT